MSHWSLFRDDTSLGYVTYSKCHVRLHSPQQFSTYSYVNNGMVDNGRKECCFRPCTWRCFRIRKLDYRLWYPQLREHLRCHSSGMFMTEFIFRLFMLWLQEMTVFCNIHYLVKIYGYEVRPPVTGCRITCFRHVNQWSWIVFASLGYVRSIGKVVD